MRRTMLFVTMALVAAAMIGAGALPTFAKEQAKTKGQGRGVGADACIVPAVYDTVQHAVNNASCQTIQLTTRYSFENVTIDRNVTITGSGANLPPIVGAPRKSAFTILPGNTVTFEDLSIAGGGGVSVEQGGGIYNQGTLVLKGVIVSDNKATEGGGIYNAGTLTMVGGQVSKNTAAKDGGGIYNAGTLTLTGTSVSSNVASGDGGGIFNQGTLYLCGSTTVSSNQAPVGTEDDISGTPAKGCPASSPPPGGGPKGGNGVLIEHKGKELCLPKAALKGHLNHGDKVIDEQGCSEAAGAKKNGKHGGGGGVSGKKQ